jgi:hypothetical protein
MMAAPASMNELLLQNTESGSYRLVTTNHAIDSRTISMLPPLLPPDQLQHETPIAVAPSFSEN